MRYRKPLPALGYNPPAPRETALPAGMLVSELLTKVFKYAFPEGWSGHVDVRIVAAGGGLTLTVSDDGVGLPAGLEARRSRLAGR